MKRIITRLIAVVVAVFAVFGMIPISLAATEATTPESTLIDTGADWGAMYGGLDRIGVYIDTNGKLLTGVGLNAHNDAGITGVMNVYLWNSNPETSRRGTLLRTMSLEAADQGRIEFHFDEPLPAGQYYYEIVCESGEYPWITLGAQGAQSDYIKATYYHNAEGYNNSQKLRAAIWVRDLAEGETSPSLPSDGGDSVEAIQIDTGADWGAMYGGLDRIGIHVDTNGRLLTGVGLNAHADSITGVLNVYAWNTDPETSRSGEVLRTKSYNAVGQGLIEFHFDETLSAGEYYYEIVYEGDDYPWITLGAKEAQETYIKDSYFHNAEGYNNSQKLRATVWMEGVASTPDEEVPKITTIDTGANWGAMYPGLDRVGAHIDTKGQKLTAVAMNAHNDAGISATINVYAWNTDPETSRSGEALRTKTVAGVGQGLIEFHFDVPLAPGEYYFELVHAGTDLPWITLGSNEIKDEYIKAAYYHNADGYRAEKLRVAIWLEEMLGHVCDYSIEKNDDKYIKTPATCTTKPVYYYSCECGLHGTESFEVDVPVGHLWNERYSTDANEHWLACSREECDAVDAKGAHTGGTATLTDKAVCEVCNRAYGTIVAPETEPDTTPDTTPDTEPDTTPDTEPDTTPDSDTESEPDTDSESVTNPESDTIANETEETTAAGSESENQTTQNGKDGKGCSSMLGAGVALTLMLSLTGVAIAGRKKQTECDNDTTVK